ncbi:MAG: helix-turn-helix transcriptional regulator [Clostridia bacterium]|nr:helix-turn-helix transcriptional regulator [Clostridia bacterium]
MIIKHYSPGLAKKLSKISLSESVNDFHIQPLWIMFAESGHYPVDYSQRLYVHNFFELHIVLSGTYHFADSKGTHKVHEGYAILVPPHYKHSSSISTDEFRRFSVSFQVSRESAQVSLPTCETFYHFAISERMISNIDSLFAEVNAQTVFSKKIINNILFEMICETISATNAVELETSSNLEFSNSMIHRAKRYVADNEHLLLSCKDVARYCHFNEIYLNRLFKEETGETLLKYVHRKKVEAAQEYLTNSSLTIEEISRNLGFTTVNYFNTFFKRITGFSPGTYRRQAQYGTPEKDDQ